MVRPPRCDRVRSVPEVPHARAPAKTLSSSAKDLASRPQSSPARFEWLVPERLWVIEDLSELSVSAIHKHNHHANKLFCSLPSNIQLRF